jgi:lysozyme
MLTIASFQNLLLALGYYTGKIDGDYGELTHEAVRKFQADHGLLVDGWFGPKTNTALLAVNVPSKDFPTFSNKGMIALIRREALVLRPYRDSKGIWTLGIGHTKSAGYPDPATVVDSMSIPAAIALFRTDLIKYETAVRNALKVSVKQFEYDALVSFEFNTGGIGRAHLTAALNAGDRKGAIAGFMGWISPPEIMGRRLAEQKQFASGDYGDTSVFPVYDKFPGFPRLVQAGGYLGE